MLSLVMVMLQFYIEMIALMLHYAGNYTFAAVKAGEDYLVMKDAFAPVLEEINNLIAASKVLVAGQEVPLQFVFGSDYKVRHNPLLFKY